MEDKNTDESLRQDVTILKIEKEHLERRVNGVETNLENYIRTERDNFKELLKMIGDIKSEISKIKWLASGVALSIAIIVIYREEIASFLKVFTT